MDFLGFDAQLPTLLPAWLRKRIFQPVEPGVPPTAAAFSEEFLRGFEKWIDPLSKYYFRCEVRGLEHIPNNPPAFIVGNHNGLGVVEIPLFGHAWYGHVGRKRHLHGLAHRIVFNWPLIKEFLPRVGAVPADPSVAYRTLEARKDLLVFPGGDWEASRPWKDRKKIDFAGRHGFIQVAYNANVPITPLVICGSHETIPIFARGEHLAHWLKLDVTQRLKTMPVTPWSLFAAYKFGQALRGKASWWLQPIWWINAWLSFPWLPSKVTMEILRPINLQAELAGIADAEERWETGYDLVTQRMQKKLDELYAEREGYLG